MARHPRPVNTLENPQRLGLLLQAAAKRRLAEMAAASGMSQSALVEWWITTAETDQDGRVVGLPEEGQEELSL